MLENILIILHGAVVLLYGVTLTAAFAGIRADRKSNRIFLIFCGLCGGLQLAASLLCSPDVVWALYPLITHLPLILLLFLGYRKPLATSMAATFTAYLLCEPSKWLGLLALEFTGIPAVEYITRIIALCASSYYVLVYFAASLAEIFHKDTRSVVIFGSVPTVYYAFDYLTSIYTDWRVSNHPVVAEFLPFFLTVTFTIFCLVYYKEHEQKAEALRKEQIVRITVEQQNKEMTAVKQAQQEIRLIRHDMRLLLSSLAVSLEHGEIENAQKLISTQIDHIDGTRLQRFCSNDSINYVLSAYAAKCEALKIPFTCVVELDALQVEEDYFASILSNGLDNALNAQKQIIGERYIKVMIKTSSGKLLMSIKNPVGKKVIFADGLPVTDRRGHGYGSQSIRFLTERLGGNCQFSVQDGVFILRVIL